MIEGLKPYPAMKDSGVPGLGKVPVHWESRNLRTVLRNVTTRNRPDLPLLSVLRERGVIVRDVSNEEKNHNFIPDDLTNYKVVHAGQFVMNKMKAWQGSYGVSRFNGIVSPAYFVFDLDNVSGDFFNLAIRSKSYVPFFTQASDGVRIAQWDLSQARMREITFSVPSLCEQAAIVHFLDYMDRRIRRYIRAKQKLIKLLEEQKQAIIHQAVTRGLDPNVRLKPSGVEWLGDVPKHWRVRSFTRCCLERADYRGATPTKTDEGVFLVTAKNIRKGWIDYRASREFVSRRDYPTIMRRGLPRTGDLLLTTEAPLGNAALVDREDVALAQRVIRFRIDHNLLDSRFVLHAVLSAYFQHQLHQKSTGSTALGIKASKLPQLQILCPPPTEQRAILDFVARECAPLDVATEQARREVGLLHEYRTRLIADVVTGKIDVRQVAARLPYDAVEAERLEDIEADGEGDNADANEIAEEPDEAEA